MDSFISWIGGKKLLRKEICARFPEIIEKYVEVFGGAAWVLFHKEKHAEHEVYNDINSNLVNLFKCVKYHSNAVKEELDYALNSRDFFNDFRELYQSSALTDIQRAAKYFYMIKASYGAKVTSFGAKNIDIFDTDGLAAIKERLKRVNIENKNFDKLIPQYDRLGTLFYCDPPYYRAEKYYDTGEIVFDKEQHIKLSEILRGLKGKCVVSYNDSNFIRSLYDGFIIDEVERSNTLSIRHGVNRTYKELIIKNF